MQNSTSYNQLLSQCLPLESFISGNNPFTIRLGGQMFYLYLRTLSWAHFNNREIWRAQLPRDEQFDEIKPSSVPFVFLGYDEENDVFATWEPASMKARLNVADYVSVYSRLSIQKAAASKQDFQMFVLNNKEVLLAFPSSKLGHYLLNFDYFFEGSPQEKYYVDYKFKEDDLLINEVQEGMASRKSYGNHVNEIDWETPFLQNGKLSKLANPDLLDVLRPLLTGDYPNKGAALGAVQQFYGDRFSETMEFQDWIKLFNHIDWMKPYAKVDEKGIVITHSPRDKIKVIFPNGRESKPNQVVKVLLEVVEYAGPEQVFALKLKIGKQDLILTSNPNNEEHIKPISDSLFINTKSKTRTKYEHICEISDRLDLGLIVSLE